MLFQRAEKNQDEEGVSFKDALKIEKQMIAEKEIENYTLGPCEVLKQYWIGYEQELSIKSMYF